MISLALTILCSTSIALILKYNDTKSGNALVLLVGNYFVAAIIAFLIWLFEPNTTFSFIAVGAGAMIGGLFVFSFFSFAKSVNAAGTALATISSRLSVVIPTLLSILFFKEVPAPYQWIGYVFAGVTLLFFYLSLKKSHTGKLNLSAYLYLFAVLVGIGINDFSLKLFNVSRPETEKQLFLFSIFAASFLYTLLIILYRKISFEPRTFFHGTVLGIPNMLSSFFLINALLGLPATLVYPVVNIGIIVLTMIAAFLIWREKLNRYGILALIAGSFSIILMNL